MQAQCKGQSKKVEENNTPDNKEEKVFFHVVFEQKLENGSLSAKLNDAPFTSGKAEKDSIITFTATPNDNYEVNKWEITGGEKIEGGEDGSLTVKVKITENITVSVSFKVKTISPQYTKIAFGELDNYLENTAQEIDINYIEITGLTQQDVAKNVLGGAAPLGEILKKYPSKKVAIKFGDDMPKIKSLQQCFYGCTNLVLAPIIPESVENMSGTFWGCTALTKAPEIPEGVKVISY
ncbi:MAG: InlB B-repeat-containing protein [Treponema sp.]